MTLRQKIDSAIERAQPDEARHFMDEQKLDALSSWFKIKAQGGDPMSQVAPEGLFTHPEVQLGIAAVEMQQQQGRVQQALDSSGWMDVQNYHSGLIAKMRARKDANRNEDPGPLVEDPNELANARQALVKANNAVREASNGKQTVWSLPQTRETAMALGTETQGAAVSGEQKLGLGVVGTAGQAALEAVEGAIDPLAHLGMGGVQLATMGLDAILDGNGAYVFEPPTKIMRDPMTGEILTDSGKVAGIADMMVATWAAATGQKIEDQVANLNAGAEFEYASRSGFQHLVLGASRVAGMFSPTGYVGVAGKVMHGGQVLGKGLTHLAVNGSRYAKHITAIAETAGAMVANGALESAMKGNIEGYGRSFMGGMWMGLPLMTIGAMGKRTEWFLRNRENMPARVAAAVGGLVEGAGFGALETATTDSLWEFLKTGDRKPLQNVFLSFAQNMIGAALTKGAMRPGVATPEVLGEVSPRTTGELQSAREVTRRAPSAELGQAIETQKATERQAEVERRKFDRTEAERRAERWSAKQAAPEVAEKAGETRLADVANIQERTEKAYRHGEQIAQQKEAQSDAQIRAEAMKVSAMADSPERTAAVVELLPRLVAKHAKEGGQAAGETAQAAIDRFRKVIDLVGRSHELGMKPEDLMAVERAWGESGAQLMAEGFTRLPAALEGTSDIILRKLALKIKPRVTGPLAEWVTQEIKRGPTETVEGKEGKPITGEKVYGGEKLGASAEFQAKFKPTGAPEFKPRRLSPEEQMVQRGGKEGLEPEVIQQKTSRDLMAEKRKEAQQGFDPLEEVTFKERPEAERRAILERRGAQERRKAAEGFEGPDLRTGADRRKFNRREWELLGEQDVPRGTSERLATEEAFSEGQRPAYEKLPTEEKPGAQPIRMSDIRLEMEGFEGDPIRATIRPGRLAKKFAAGLARLREDLIRTQDDFDTATMAHEWAHLMQSKTVGMRHRFPDPAVNAELMKIGTPVAGPKASGIKLISEGFAEFWARHALGDPVLRTEAPNAFRHLTEWLTQKGMEPYARQYGRIQGAIQRWKDIGALGRHRMLVENQGEPSEQELKAGLRGKKAAVHRAVQTVSQTMFDDVANLKARETHFLKRAGIDPSDVPISQTPSRVYDLYRMRGRAISEQMLREGTIDLQGNQTGASLEEALAGIKESDLQDFMSYMIAVKSLDLAAKGEKTILPVEDHLAVAEKLDRPQWRRVAQEVTDYFGRVLDYTVEAGVQTEADAAKIKNNIGVWLPMLKTMGGNLKDPLQGMANVTSAMVARAHDSMVRKAMVMQSVRLKGQGGFVTQVPKKSIPQQHSVKELMKAIEKADVPGDIKEMLYLMNESYGPELAGTMATLFRPELFPPKNEPIIAHKVAFTQAEIAAESDAYTKKWMKANNGKELFFEMDREAHEALMGLEDPRIAMFGSLPEGVQRIIRAPAQTVRFGATLTNPGFQVWNMVRDTMTYGAYTKTDAGWIPFSGIGAAIQGIKHMATKSPEYMRYKALGGGGETLIAHELFGGKARAVLHGAEHPVNVARMLTRQAVGVLNSGEQVLRVREFASIRAKAISEGKSQLDATLEAMEASREVTINFTRGGSLSRAINQVTPYFNAGLQGNRKMWRTLMGSEGGRAQAQLVTQALSSITALTALNYFFHGDEDWYQELPEWRRNGYWNFKNPFTGKPITVPKPYGLGQIFSTPFEMGLDLINGKDPISAKNALADFIGGQFGGWSLIPAAVLPSAEVATNHKFFSGNPILPYWTEATKLPADQYTAYTTGVAKWLGKEFGVSPAKLEHWIGGTTGGLSTRIFRSVDFLAGTSRTPRTSLENVPGFGKMFEQGEFAQSRSVNRIYELSDELSQKRGSKATELGDRAKLKVLDRAKASISAIRKAAKEGRITEDEANRRSSEIARSTLKRYE